MKKAFKIVGFYFFSFAFILIVGTFFYAIFLSILKFSAGTNGSLFTKSLIFKAFKDVAMSCCFLLCPLVTVYRIRHKGGLSQLLFYIALCGLTWLFLLPISLTKLNFVKTEDVQKKVLSKNYFRESDNEIFYFTEDLEQDGKEVQSVVINPTKDNSIQIKQIKADKDFVLFAQAAPYNDTFTKEAFSGGTLLGKLEYAKLFSSARIALNKGFSFWLFFLSLALAICSVYGLSNVTNWKLLNTGGVFFSTFLILFINVFYYDSKLQGFRTKLLQNGAFSSLSKIMDEPFLVLINLLFSFICIMIGIIVYFAKKNKVSVA